jgi:hypothetical protein
MVPRRSLCPCSSVFADAPAHTSLPIHSPPYQRPTLCSHLASLCRTSSLAAHSSSSSYRVAGIPPHLCRAATPPCQRSAHTEHCQPSPDFAVCQHCADLLHQRQSCCWSLCRHSSPRRNLPCLVVTRAPAGAQHLARRSHVRVPRQDLLLPCDRSCN